VGVDGLLLLLVATLLRAEKNSPPVVAAAGRRFLALTPVSSHCTDMHSTLRHPIPISSFSVHRSFREVDCLAIHREGRAVNGEWDCEFLFSRSCLNTCLDIFLYFLRIENHLKDVLELLSGKLTDVRLVKKNTSTA
jgi:hypothetical protein